MTTQFLSRVSRIDGITRSDDETQLVGPGSYDPPGAIKLPLPGFVPFSTTSKRVPITTALDTPPPGTYTISRSLLTNTNNASNAFRSKTQRFTDDTIKKNMSEEVILHTTSSLGNIDKSMKNHQTIITNRLAEILATAPFQPTVPSIPNRFQSYGYEEWDGKLVLQQPLHPGYSGLKHDTVGPLDYDPSTDGKRSTITGANFSKSAGRRDKELSNRALLPGPGYYNTFSSFDLLNPENSQTDADFVYRMAAAKKRPNATFESKTQRNALGINPEGPGPGDYFIPAVIQAPRPLSPDQQNFSSSGPRFQDSLPKSMQLTVAPGQYNPITSDFDKSKIKILRQKRVASRSGWAQNISFASTEKRFEIVDKNGVPAAGTYRPKTTLADNIPKQNVRAGPFGASSVRFDEKTDFERIPLREQIAAIELSKGMGYEVSSASSQSNNSHAQRPKFSVNFGSKESRFPREKSLDGPGPTTYNTTPAWDKVGTIKMVQINGSPTRVREDNFKIPGVGEYNISTDMAFSKPNRKNILITSSPRTLGAGLMKSDNPGPGHYNVQTSLIRPSHNAFLSEH